MSRRAVAGGIPGLTWETGAVTYVNLNSLQIAGDARSRYPVGTVVYVPGPNAFASVLSVQYSTNTTLVLSDSVCFSGMFALGYIPPAATLQNIAPTGTPISGGYFYGQPAWAFDGVLSGYDSGWLSSQTTTSVSGNAYLGVTFGAVKSIRWVDILQDPGFYHDNIQPITSALFQYADGGAWTTFQTLTLTGAGWERFIFAPPASGHTQWRLLANANTTIGGWGIIELRMGE